MANQPLTIIIKQLVQCLKKINEPVSVNSLVQYYKIGIANPSAFRTKLKMLLDIASRLGLVEEHNGYYFASTHPDDILPILEKQRNNYSKSHNEGSCIDYDLDKHVDYGRSNECPDADRGNALKSPDRSNVLKSPDRSNALESPGESTEIFIDAAKADDLFLEKLFEDAGMFEVLFEDASMCDELFIDAISRISVILRN